MGGKTAGKTGRKTTTRAAAGAGRRRPRAAAASARPGADGAARQALLQAGARLLAKGGRVAALTPPALLREAGSGRAGFSRNFADRDAYLLALLEYLLDEARAEVLPRVSQLAPGRERVWAAIEGYLDANLKRPEMRALALDLRGNAAVSELLQRRASGFAMLVKLELEAQARGNAAACGRLITAMAVEVIVAEHRLRRRDPELRHALRGFIERA